MPSTALEIAPAADVSVPVAQKKRPTLLEFLRVSYELLSDVPMPERLVSWCGENGDDYTTALRALLVCNGWQDRGTFLTLNRPGELVYAYIRVRTNEIEMACDGQNWWGGFAYAIPFPQDLKVLRIELDRRSCETGDEYIELYKRNRPGLDIAVIHANTMQVTSWYWDRADRRSPDFARWMQVFERLFDGLDFSGFWNRGETMFDTVYDPYWQWTTKSEDELTAMIQNIGDTAEDEAEVRQRVRDELGYEFDNIRVCFHKTSMRQKNWFDIEISGPGGRSHRIFVTNSRW